ncbi:MAG: ABC transporter ATP-binding protein [Actinomycetaceae bacterium]|nr:ABC transporter ATP-binding protein [Actinomycetaceae bacterium]
MDSPALIVARRLSKSYRTVSALAGVDLRIGRGESLAIMGPSGAGKSTLLLVLAGIIRADHGSVVFDQLELNDMHEAELARMRRKRCGFVFQDDNLIPELTAIENVAMPLLVDKHSRHDAFAKAEKQLDIIGFQPDKHIRCHYLSGGENQLVAIARALVNAPDVIFADEPTGALDQATGQEVMQLLSATTSKRQTTLVVVTHDRNVATWCDRIIEIRDGVIQADTPLSPGSRK